MQNLPAYGICYIGRYLTILQTLTGKYHDNEQRVWHVLNGKVASVNECEVLDV